MFKAVLAAVWLGFSLRSLFYALTQRADLSFSLLDLRAFLGRGKQDVVSLLDRLQKDSALLAGFRRSLFLNAAGLLVEVVLYAVVTFSFQRWGELIFGALVLASHLHSIIMLLLLAFLVHNRQWFILTFKKAQVLIVPGLVLEILWLAYLVVLWTGFLDLLL
ncbi:MAG: hypothetical protein H0Z38_06120 [Firmicutes bacterium]|nr:hypothetical protein [Bacillota bacterium]